MNVDMIYHLPQVLYYEIIEKAYRKFGFNLEILEEASRLVEAKRKKCDKLSLYEKVNF